MSRELHCYQQKNALTVLVSTARLPFSLAPRSSSRHELNQTAVYQGDRRSSLQNSKENVNV
jgi:hypothetical protein